MSFDAQINFRSTSTYVTDGAGQTYSLGEAYPTTRAGLTFGWSASITGGARDRTASGDVRLAGVNQVDNSIPEVRSFRLDGLTAGSVTVHLAIGDSGGQVNQYAQILDSDGSTVLATINLIATGTASNEYADATGTKYSRANWPASETGLSLTITGTSIYCKIGLPSAGFNSTTIAHFRAVQGGGGGSILPMVRHHRGKIMRGN